MNEDDLETFVLYFKDLIDSENPNKIKDIISKIINHLTISISKELDLFLIKKFNKIIIGDVEETVKINFGVKRRENTLFFGSWLFEFPKMVKESLLLFLIIKEAFMQFTPKMSSDDVDESILSFISIIWLKEHFSIRSIDHRIIADITSRIFPSEIAGKRYIYWLSLLNLLFANNISYQSVFRIYYDLSIAITNEISSQSNLIDSFHNWVIDNTITSESVISPILLTDRLYRILDLLYSLGYQKGTTSVIAKKMNVHQNTIRNAFSDLMSNFATYWRPIINYEKMNLHNYFYLIEPSSPDYIDSIINDLNTNPYLKSIYRGENTFGKTVIYSPTLICPHYISDLINKKFKNWETKGLIDNFYLQLMRSRKIFHAISTEQFDTSITNFEEFLRGKKNSSVKKFLLTNEIVDFSIEFNAENPEFDYNILYFLSILRNKFLLKARYGVLVNELPELYKRNNIDLKDINSQTDFINQIEIRARRRKLLTYSLFISSFKKGSSEVLLLEIPYEIGKEEQLNEVIDKIRIFSFLAQINLFNKCLLTIPGITHDHQIAQILLAIFREAGFEVKPYTIELVKSKMVPLHELYDFEEKKWFLGLEK